MSEDFFGDLGKSISRYTQNAVDKTSTFFEATKISAQISTEQKEIDKLYQKIGETVYRRAESRQMQLDDDLAAFVEEIRSHREQISSRRKDLADVKGKKVCPSCGELIPREVAFCPKCGAPSPADEDREEADQPKEDTAEQEAEESASTTEEAAGSVKEGQQ